MDYEVFLLSRVREEYLRSGDNTRSVTTGIASTARVIASAALIMISVFFGFVLGTDPIVKMMGVGLAVAVFLDATIVRVVLVPASMKLMGHANWWLPKWLDRILPNLDIEGDSGLPAPAYREGHGPTVLAVAASAEPEEQVAPSWVPAVHPSHLPAAYVVEPLFRADPAAERDPYLDLVARIEEAYLEMAPELAELLDAPAAEPTNDAVPAHGLDDDASGTHPGEPVHR
jgi:RND superfamily putative drug exporter